MQVNVHPHDEKGEPQPHTEAHIDKNVLLHLDSTNDDLDLLFSQDSFIIRGKLQGENPNEVRSDLERNILPPASGQWDCRTYFINTERVTTEIPIIYMFNV